MQNVITWMLSTRRSEWGFSSEDLRNMWLDYEDLREIDQNLIESRDPEGYARCICKGFLAFNNVNSSVPIIRYPWAFEVSKTSMYMNFAFCEVLKVFEGHHSANYYTGSGGGTTIPINDRAMIIGGLRKELQAQCLQDAQDYKGMLIVNGAFGFITDEGQRGEYGLSGYPAS